MAKKNPIAAAAKKMAAAPVSNSTVEVKAAETKTVKAEAKAEAPKAEAKKAEEPKKETAKKAPAKRTTAKDIKTSVVVQFAGKEVTEKDLIGAGERDSQGERADRDRSGEAKRYRSEQICPG